MIKRVFSFTFNQIVAAGKKFIIFVGNFRSAENQQRLRQNGFDDFGHPQQIFNIPNIAAEAYNIRPPGNNCLRNFLHREIMAEFHYFTVFFKFMQIGFQISQAESGVRVAGIDG